MPPDHVPAGTATTTHRYPAGSLTRDYLLAAAGLAIAVAPSVFAEPGRVAMIIFGAIGGLSLLLALRTFRRQTCRFLLSADWLEGGGRRLSWEEVTGVRLKHFATRRSEPSDGWMELSLKSPAGRVKVDTDLDGFLAIARAAHGAVLANRLRLDPASVANFRALGLDCPSQDDEDAADRETLP
ncbi:MAG: hypothetical protein R3229_04335 [Alphaproteobacteria bacterium]|nr:hypothetical protein [Alphaproteobacteria bacterium]